MSKELRETKTIKLSGTANGVISVGKIEEPYGAGSEAVASIAVSLKGDASEAEWKVHIPLANIDEVVAALQALK